MNDDAFIAQLEQRLAELKAQIAELTGNSSHNGERRALETQAGYICHQLDAYGTAHILARRQRPVSA
jgi:hypothetical protein